MVDIIVSFIVLAIAFVIVAFGRWLWIVASVELYEFKEKQQNKPRY